MTKTYNRFHDPDETRSADRGSAGASRHHGPRRPRCIWLDATSPPTAGSCLDYEIDEEEWGTRKKPYRYRWPAEVRDEVLARLLELNAARAAEETLSGTNPAASPPGVRGASNTRRAGRQRSGRIHTVVESRTLWDAAPSRESDIGGNA